MFSVSGRMPVVCTVAILALAVSDANSQQRNPLTLAEAEDLALAAEPGQAAFEARAEALAERSVAAGSLPAPMLRVGLNNYPIEGGSFSTEAMTNAQFGVRQAFPPGHTRAIDRRRHEWLAAGMGESADARGRDVLVSVRHAWLDSYYWEQAHVLVSESRPFFEDLAAITRSLYAVGRRNQQDVLRAELELSRLDDRLITIDQQRALARAALGEWIGDAAARPVAPALPRWGGPPSRETLAGALASHPSLRAADAQVEAQDAAVDLADERSKPGWAVDFGYNYREGLLPDGDPRSDMVSLSVSVDLPFIGGKHRQDRELAAALAERRAATNSRERLRRELQAKLDAGYAQWEDADRRLALYSDRILAQADEHAQAALVAYQSDRGDFSDVMRGYIDNLNVKLDYVRIEVERARAWAVLANLGGLPR